MRVRADVADRDVAVTRSGLTCWLRSAPSDQTFTSAPGGSAAGRGERLGGDAVPGSELDQPGGVRADLLLGPRAAGALARQAAGSRPQVYQSRDRRPHPGNSLVPTTALIKSKSKLYYASDLEPRYGIEP